jgi:hypothetical protein
MHDVFDRLLPGQDRRVHAPTCSFGSPALISVNIADDEDVEWHYTYLADGRKMVTGYTVVKSTNRGGAATR